MKRDPNNSLPQLFTRPNVTNVEVQPSLDVKHTLQSIHLLRRNADDDDKERNLNNNIFFPRNILRSVSKEPHQRQNNNRQDLQVRPHRLPNLAPLHARANRRPKLRLVDLHNLSAPV